MATVKELRLRVLSLKNTRKITSAMKMVSASKLRRAKDAAAKTRPYILKLSEMLFRLYDSIESIDNPLLKSPDSGCTRFIVFTSDRGLCGGFNNNLIKFFRSESSLQAPLSEVCVVGKKAYDALRKQKFEVSKYYQNAASTPDFSAADRIAKDAIQDFTSGAVSRVVLVYNKFISSLTQKPSAIQLLPLIKEEKSEKGFETEKKMRTDYLFEPDSKSLLNELLPKQITIQVFKALLDNAVGEHAARMTAMDNATNNANELINSLTVKMNRARQAAITTELIEIISGAEAL